MSYEIKIVEPLETELNLVTCHLKDGRVFYIESTEEDLSVLESLALEKAPVNLIKRIEIEIGTPSFRR